MSVQTWPSFQDLAAGKAELVQVYVELAHLHPNPWNPNVMEERVYEAERESIRRFGFIDPMFVRPHEDLDDGDFQIVDGEHRHRAAIDEGLTRVPCNPVSMSDDEAKKLTVIFNETRGHPDVAKLGLLLKQLSESKDAGELSLGLPYTDDELKHLLAIGDTDWDQWSQNNPDADGGTPPAERFVVSFAVTKAQHQRFERFTKMLGREWGEDLGQNVVKAVEQAARSL